MSQPVPPDINSIKETIEKPMVEINLICESAIMSHIIFDNDHKNPSHTMDDNNFFRPSYHNADHIAGINRFTNIVLELCHHGNDPFDLQGEFDKYLNAQPNSALTFDDLKIALLAAFSCHDLGNITSTSAVILNDGIPRFEFADKYQFLPGTKILENRGADITEALINTYSSSNWNKKSEFVQLVRYLIMQTVFDPAHQPLDPPTFWQFVQVADQIGSGFYSDQLFEENIAGLIVEQRLNGRTNFDISAMWGFPHDRLIILVPDEIQRRRITQICEFNKYGRTFSYHKSLPRALQQLDAKADPVVELMNMVGLLNHHF